MIPPSVAVGANEAAARQSGAQLAVISLEDIEEGFGVLRFEVSADDLELSDRYYGFPRPFPVCLDVTRTGQMFGFKGQIAGVARGECCRCLTDVDQPLDAAVELMVQRKEASEDELEALAEEDLIRIIEPGSREFDVRETLRDSLALELPMRVYCRPDCKGLCSSCGQNLNEAPCDCTADSGDPRWQALAHLKSHQG